MRVAVGGKYDLVGGQRRTVARQTEAAALATSLLGYPLWAFLQLLALLALPHPLLRRAGAGRRATIAGLALLFALAHWPNGPLMLVCAVAMAIWARVWSRHPSLPATALAMGVAATALLQLGPADAFSHARVGPRLARQRLAVGLAAGGAGPADTTDLRAVVRAYFPAATGRPAAPDQADAWARALARRLRERIAWQFLTSDELRARAPERAAPRTARFVMPDEPWRGRIAALGADAYRRDAGGDDRAFLRALYRDVLAREPAEAELDDWAPAFAPGRPQRRALATALFDARRVLARAPGDTVSARRLRLP